MSLFSSLQQANNALNAAQVGLQVTGNNIANVNTPDYLRQRVIYTPAPTQALAFKSKRSFNRSTTSWKNAFVARVAIWLKVKPKKTRSRS